MVTVGVHDGNCGRRIDQRIFGCRKVGDIFKCVVHVGRINRADGTSTVVQQVSHQPESFEPNYGQLIRLSCYHDVD